MAHYRAYTVEDSDGSFSKVDTSNFDTDDAALQWAKALGGERVIELWVHDRFVAKLDLRGEI